jgi:hypothetical protein
MPGINDYKVSCPWFIYRYSEISRFGIVCMGKDGGRNVAAFPPTAAGRKARDTHYIRYCCGSCDKCKHYHAEPQVQGVPKWE